MLTIFKAPYSAVYSYKFRFKLFLVKRFKKKLNKSLFIRFYGISDVKAIQDFTDSYDLMKNEIHVTLPL